MQNIVLGTRPRYANELRRDRRKVPNDIRRTWQVSEIWDRHHKIKRLIFLGYDNVEIAEKVGCHTQTVSLVRNSKVIKDQLAVMHAAADAKTIDIRREIQELAPVCLDLLKDVVKGDRDGKNANIALRTRTAQDILDRAGHGRIQRSEALVGHFTADELREIKEDAKAKARENGQIIEEAEYEEVN